MELKRVVYGIIMSISLIVVRLINKYLYDMPTLASFIFLILIMVVSYNLVDRSLYFDRQISRKTYYLLNTLIVTLLIVAFYTIKS
ncbi:hypothetical protein [Paenisporosarcina indica]|uniref:hypothetical protein n=1 Tax=Paenisporosarcina indica TaxID=650093 RepID=UPI00095000D1|nr:hypothetical protein [Paenisporosarcina indica]